MVWGLLTINPGRITKIFTIIMPIFNYCHTGFTFFFSYIRTSLSQKGLVVSAIMFGGATGMMMFCFVPLCIADSDTLQIAVIGPMSGKDHEGGQAMLDGVNLYVNEVNQSGGINGRTLEVIAYDDQNNKAMARNKAMEIAKKSKALVVIGHYFSSTSLEGGKIYKEYGIPAVTASATAPQVTEGNGWYFRVVPDTNLQGKFSALYIKNILEQEAVNIVFEQDAYGTTLNHSFGRASRDSGLRIKNVWSINSEIDDVDRKFDAITQELQLDPNPGALFVALQDHEAAKLVRSIRDAGIQLAIMGGDAIGSESFQRQFVKIPSETRNPGHYTDGIYATTFFISDISNRKARQFTKTFIRRFGREPDDMVATHYDAAAIAVEAIRKAKIEIDVAQSRKNIRNQLSSFRTIETAHKGITGRIFFDEHGNVVKPFPIGVYSHGRLISAPTQLGPIVNLDTIVDLQKELAEGNIIPIDDLFVYRTMVIYTGIDINEISNINPRNETFTADFYLWFRHRGYLDYSKIEFLNAVEDLRLRDEPIMEMTVQNTTYRAYRIKGDFNEEFIFRDYPFDSQTLSIRFRHKKFNSERLVFVTDDIGMQRYGGRTPAERLKEYSGLSKAAPWHLQDILVFSDIGAADSTLGNPGMFHATADTAISYSRFNVVTEIERNAKSYVLKNLMPLFIVVLLGYIMLFVSPEGPPFVARMSLGVIALLTAVFLRLEAAGQLPNIGYLVALDYMYFAVYVLILSGIVITVAKHRALLRENDILAKRLDYFGRMFQPIYIVIGIGIFVYLY
jgi:branched-chain amino acid transport system substrate-binding protein